MDENKVGVHAIAANPAPATATATPVAEAAESSPLSFSSQTLKRKRFTIDLVPGETTVVSWKKLLIQANYQIDEPSAPIEVSEETEPAVYRLNQYTQTQDEKDDLLQKEMPGTKHSDKSLHWERENIEHINEASKEICRSKKRRKDKVEAAEEKVVHHHHVKPKAALRTCTTTTTIC